MLDKSFILAMLYESALGNLKFERWSSSSWKDRVLGLVFYFPSLLLVVIGWIYLYVYLPLGMWFYSIFSKK